MTGAHCCAAVTSEVIVGTLLCNSMRRCLGATVVSDHINARMT